MTAAASAPAASAATRYEVVVGIEIHVQLKTASKMFCGCSTDVRGAPPNTLTCPVCLGLPGRAAVKRRAVEHVSRRGGDGASIRPYALGPEEYFIDLPRVPDQPGDCR